MIISYGYSEDLRGKTAFLMIYGLMTLVIVADNHDLNASGANTWQEVSKKGKDVWPEARQGHSAVVFNGSMFLFGGLSQDNFTALQDMLYFDFTSVTWKQITGPNDQTPGPRCHHSCVLLEEKGKMLIMGGSLNLRSYHSDVWEFNLESFVWKKLDLELPSPRAGIMVLHDEKDKTLHLFGGYTGDGGFTYLNDAYELNLDVEWKFEKYEPKGTLPYTGRHLGAVYALECFWVFGGFDGKHAVSEFYYFDPKCKYDAFIV
jgi:N-acetylneuraminic acid mutarotase